MQALVQQGQSLLLIVLVMAAAISWLPSEAGAQITIKERMELQAQASTDIQTQSTARLPNDPILYPMEDGYMVLKTGNLKLFVAGAQGYGPLDPENTELEIKVYDQHDMLQREETYSLESYLRSPIVVENDPDPACTDPSWFYQKEVTVFKNAEQDSYVDKFNSIKNYGYDVGLSVRGFSSDSDDDTERAYIHFGVDNLSITNGQLAMASMGIQAADRPYDEPYPSFTVAKANDSWSESGITWDNQPSFSGGYRVTNNDVLDTGLIETPEDTLRKGIFSFNIFDYVNSWLSGASDDGIVLRGVDGSLYFASRHETLVVIPGLQLEFINTEPQPANAILDLGYVEAGDVIDFSYRGLQVSSGSTQRLSENTREAATQWLRFSDSSSPCISEEWLETGVLMDEDTARAPYMELALRPDSTEITPGSITSVVPLLKFDNGGLFSFPQGQQFTAAITEGGASATLLRPFGSETAPDTADVLDPVTDLWALVAADSLAADSVVAAMQANTLLEIGIDTTIGVTGIDKGLPSPVLSQANGGQTQLLGPQPWPFAPNGPYVSMPISGEGQVVIVREDSLNFEIEIPDPREVWPTILAEGAQRRLDFSEIDNVLENIEVSLTRGNEPIANQDVEITAQWVSQSGGHYHETNAGRVCRSRPIQENPPIDTRGWIVNVAEGDSLEGRLNTFTSSEGTIPLNYRAPLYGGKMVLVANSVVDGETLIARDTLTIKIPDLVNLPDNGTNYDKVGGTFAHRGPRLDNSYANYREPDENHYGTEAFVDSLVSLADAWNEKVLADTTMDNRQTPLNINDMSLPFGGVFDICGGWREPHSLHRVGRDVDIRTTRSFPIGNNRSGVHLTRIENGGRVQYRNLKFEELLEEKGANPAPEIHQPEHYHIFFYPKSQE